MSETVVHVTTLEQWKSVLDVWFEQGYEWRGGRRGYQIYFFENHLGRHLKLGRNHEISYWSLDGCNESFIEYSEFMAQQKEDNKMETYYVTREQLDLIEELKYELYPAYNLLNTGIKYRTITHTLDNHGEKALLRYIGGDETIEFKVKEPLYRLWRDEMDNDIVYMTLNNFGTPNWTMEKENAFTAPLEEIKKWQTPAWEIEKVEVQ